MVEKETPQKKKKVRAYFNSLKFQGILVEEDSTTYVVDDWKDGIVRLPKNNTILYELKPEEEEEEK